MRSGLLIPVSNEALAFALIAAVIVTIVWFIYHLISHANKKSEEATFNNSYQRVEQSVECEPTELAQLLSQMPLRRANIDGGTVLFWTNDGPLALAVARANPQSPFKVFLRADRSASELGHKILVSGAEEHSVALKITAESLIFSNQESTLYDVSLQSLNDLVKLLKENSCVINKRIEIPTDSAQILIRWISQALNVHTHSQERLLIGE